MGVGGEEKDRIKSRNSFFIVVFFELEVNSTTEFNQKYSN